ncbi:MAG: hypothetical protein IKN67_00135 [Alphaproteobacteria bacterium]|nr:hypothetical protein [Alphaproteobacteria bacterium]
MRIDEANKISDKLVAFLREERLRQGMSQYKLDKECGLSKSENLFPLLIGAPKGSGSLCFHSVIYPDELRFRKIQAIGFQDMHKRPDNGDYLERTVYHCVFDDSDFKGWV